MRSDLSPAKNFWLTASAFALVLTMGLAACSDNDNNNNDNAVDTPQGDKPASTWNEVRHEIERDVVNDCAGPRGANFFLLIRSDMTFRVEGCEGVRDGVLEMTDFVQLNENANDLADENFANQDCDQSRVTVGDEFINWVQGAQDERIYSATSTGECVRGDRSEVEELRANLQFIAEKYPILSPAPVPVPVPPDVPGPTPGVSPTPVPMPTPVPVPTPGAPTPPPAPTPIPVPTPVGF